MTEKGLTKEEILKFFKHVTRLCAECVHGQKGICGQHRCLVRPLANYHDLARTRPGVVDAFLLKGIEPEKPKPALRQSFPSLKS